MCGTDFPIALETNDALLRDSYKFMGTEAAARREPGPHSHSRERLF